MLLVFLSDDSTELGYWVRSDGFSMQVFGKARHPWVFAWNNTVPGGKVRVIA